MCFCVFIWGSRVVGPGRTRKNYSYRAAFAERGWNDKSRADRAGLAASPSKANTSAALAGGLRTPVTRAVLFPKAMVASWEL